MGKSFYARDLAYIHESGYLGFADRAARGILRTLSENCAPGDLIVEIGCGSGGLTRHLVGAGYRVLGVDTSGAMLSLARKRVRRARFRRSSFYEFTPPRCSGIVAAGECFNYMERGKAGHIAGAAAFFTRAARALPPGGTLLFDFLEPTPSRRRRRAVHHSGDDWIVTVEAELHQRVLRRKITTIRQTGTRFRVSTETHRQFLFTRVEIARMLMRAGFVPSFRKGYGASQLGPGHVVVKAVRRGDEH